MAHQSATRGTGPCPLGLGERGNYCHSCVSGDKGSSTSGGRVMVFFLGSDVGKPEKPAWQTVLDLFFLAQTKMSWRNLLTLQYSR